MTFNLIKKSGILILLISLFNCWAESINIDYYGIASKDADRNMLSMTENIYFTQLNEMNLSVTDKRNDFFSENFYSMGQEVFSTSQSPSRVFYVEIQKLPSAKWICKINLKNLSNSKTNTFSKEYDSYYKIMMESKTTLNEIFSDLLIPPEEKQASASTSSNKLNTELLAGTWSGEQTINKIMILRGGRGFVIFKNGASMNISVKIENDENQEAVAIITQSSGNNASFFPDLDRKKALELAVEAKPISWNLKLTGEGKLSGTKNTFLQNENSVEWGEIKVEWTKSL